MTRINTDFEKDRKYPSVKIGVIRGQKLPPSFIQRFPKREGGTWPFPDHMRGIKMTVSWDGDWEKTL
jgi:hypothetical protein